MTGALAAITAAGGVAAGVPSRESPRALERVQRAHDRLPGAARELAGLRAGESRRVADFVSAAGTPRAVFVTRTADAGLVCLWDTNLVTGEQAGGCNPAGDFFAGRAVSISLAYEGGPAVRSVGDARIVGLVTDAVARVEVVNSAGRTTPVHITKDRGFAHVVPRGELARGIGPAAVVAYGASGQELDRHATGITR